MSSNRLPPLRTTSIRANVEGAALERLSGRGTEQPRGGDVDVLLNVALQRWSGNRGANGRVYKIGPLSSDGSSNDNQTRAFAQAFANMAGVELGANEDPAQNPAFVRALVNHVGRGIAGRRFREVVDAPIPQPDPRRRPTGNDTDRVEPSRVAPTTERRETAQVNVPLPRPAEERPVDSSPAAVATDARTIAQAAATNPGGAIPPNQLATRLNRAKPDDAAYTAAVTSAVQAVDQQPTNRGAALDAVVRAAGTDHARKFLDVVGGDRPNTANTPEWTAAERRDFFRRSGTPDAQGRTPLLDAASADELGAMSRAMLTDTNADGSQVPRTLADNERVAAAVIHARAIAARPDDQVLPNAEYDMRFAYGTQPTGLSSLDTARASLPEAERTRLQARLAERIGGITPTRENEAQLRAALAMFPNENPPAQIAALRARLDPAAAAVVTPPVAEPAVDTSEARTRANALLTPEGDRYQAVRDALAQTSDPAQRRALTEMLMQPGSQRALTPAELGQLGVDLRLGSAEVRSSVHDTFRSAADAAIARAPSTPRRDLAQAIASVDRANAVSGNFMTLTRLLRETPDLDADARAAGFGALRAGFERQPGILANAWNRTGIVSSALHEQPVADRVRFVNDFLATVPQTQRAAVDEQIAKSLSTRANSAYAWQGDRAGPIAELANGLTATQPELAARIHRAAIAEMNDRNRGHYLAAMSDDALRTVIAGQLSAGPNALRTTMQNELMRREMTAANEARARINIGETWNLFNDGTQQFTPRSAEDSAALAAAIGAGDNLAYFQANNFRGITDPQLANFAAFVPEGPVRTALQAEMTRRGISPTPFNPYAGIYPVQTPGGATVSAPLQSEADQRASSYLTAFAGSTPISPDQLVYVFSPAGAGISQDLRRQTIAAYFQRVARAPANQQADMVTAAYRAIGSDTMMRSYAGTLVPPQLQGFWEIAGLTDGM